MTAAPASGGLLSLIRTCWRLAILGIGIATCFLWFALLRVGAFLGRRPFTAHDRARWMQFCCRLALQSLGIRSRIVGVLPTGITLIVANHLSYLDILICSAALPCTFVAKREIAHWPIFGAMARLGGTLFVNRESRHRSHETAEEMADRLHEGVPVLFFPEGTSTDGAEVLRFHSALFDPAIEAQLPVTPAAIFYETTPPQTERDLCWFGDETFLPHMLRVLGGPSFTAVVQFSHPETFPDRRAAAWRSHDTIEQMRNRHHHLTQKSPHHQMVS